MVLNSKINFGSLLHNLYGIDSQNEYFQNPYKKYEYKNNL